MPAVQALEWADVDSSNVQSVAWHEPTETLCVKFHHGGLYSYSDINRDMYVGLVHAPSVGKYLNHMVKGLNPYIKWFSEGELEDHLNNSEF